MESYQIWYYFILISKNASEIEYISIDLASYIHVILDCLQSKKYHEAIMDDHLLFTPTRKSHMANLENLLKALLNNGLKISAKKCQLFKNKLQYMGNTIFHKDRGVCVKSLRSCLEAIQK